LRSRIISQRDRPASIAAREFREGADRAGASRPGQLSFGSAGIGSPNHLSLELFQAMAGVRMVHVPTRDRGQLVGDLLAGQVQLASMGLPVAVPHVQSSKLRAIAVTGAARSPLLPEVRPERSGITGIEVTSWYGVFRSCGTARRHRRETQFRDRQRRYGARRQRAPRRAGSRASVKAPDQFARYVRQEITKWAKVVKDSGAKASERLQPFLPSSAANFLKFGSACGRGGRDQVPVPTGRISRSTGTSTR